nr:rRNA maturation RNase YbeY [Salinibacter ruber]
MSGAVPPEYPEPLSIEHDHPSRELDAGTLRHVIHHVVDAEGASLTHLSLVLTDHDTVRRLNQSYLDHDYDTDVLSFSLREGPAPSSGASGEGIEGEVYVDLDTAAERHDEFDTSFEREAYRYVVHGLLHLVGYDDAQPAGQDKMREKEDQYLNAVLPAPSS